MNAPNEKMVSLKLSQAVFFCSLRRVKLELEFVSYKARLGKRPIPANSIAIFRRCLSD